MKDYILQFLRCEKLSTYRNINIYTRSLQTLAQEPDAALGEPLYGPQQDSGPNEPLALAGTGGTLQAVLWLCYKGQGGCARASGPQNASRRPPTLMLSEHL